MNMPKMTLRVVMPTAALCLIALFCIMSIAPALFVNPTHVMAHPGTPEPDQDGDGISNDLDGCPTTPGPAYTGGCPDPFYEQNVAATAAASQQQAAPPAQPTPIPPTAAPNPITARIFPVQDANVIRAALETGAVSFEDTITLTSAAGTGIEIIRELQTLEEIPSGGVLRLELPFMFLSGRGDLFLGLASNSPSQNLVMGADISFTANPVDDQTLEICSLGARVERDSNRNAIALLEIAVLNNGGIAVIDRAVSSVTPVVNAVNMRVDTTTPQRLIAVIQDNLVDVYVNQQRVMNDVEVSARVGTYGLSLVGRGTTVSPRCEASNFWLYTYE